MIISGGQIEAGARLEADLVIVGAGAAGITIAKKLAGTPLRIVVLESGPLEFDSFAQSLYRGAIVGQPTDALDVGRLRYFGGSTNHWGGWCRPLERSDFEARAGWPDNEWPIRRSNLDAYYAQACGICHLGPPLFDNLGFWQSQPGGKALLAFKLDPAKLRTAIFEVSPIRFGEAHGDALKAASNIRVILEATTLELVPAADSHHGKSRKSVGSVNVITKGGKKFSVSARAFVVATGGIESARLLLLSDKINPAGAGNENDLVGRYFMDHPWMTNAAYLQFSRAGTQAPLYFNQTAMAKTRIFAAIASAPEFVAREQIGAFRFVLSPSRTSMAGLDSARLVADDVKRGKIPDQIGGHLSRILSDIDVIADSVYKSVTGSKRGFHSEDSGEPYVGAFVDLTFEQKPNRDSRVLLDSDRDAYGQRRVRLDWHLSDTDFRTATRALDIAAREFGRLGLGRTRLRLDVSNGAPWPPELKGSDHHSGTARMSKDAKTGVVDADSRVHSVDNLYVAGSAVFPSQGYANPTLTIVALSLRLADHLHQVLS